MKHFSSFVGSIALSLVAFGLVACASPDDSPFTPNNPDTGVPGDTATDSPGETPTPVCTPGDLDKRACGKCGKQIRSCGATGEWLAWKACEDEIADAECSIAETRSDVCGNCGTQKDTCDPVSCTWTTGACEKEGECEAGTSEISTASCTTPGEVRTRECSTTCKWGLFGACALQRGWVTGPVAPTALTARALASSVWTGKQMIVWGGYTAAFGITTKNDGASLDVASTTWTMLKTAPSPMSGGRYRHTATWDGTNRMYVWGGIEGAMTAKDTGAYYDVTKGDWTPLTTTGAPSARGGHGAVWSTTTKELIVWGGCTSPPGSFTGSCSSAASDGFAYDPATDRWTALPPAPPGFAGRWLHSMEWTGTEVVIWGGQGSGFGVLKDGARYDPISRVWTTFGTPTISGRAEHASMWSGKELLVWGGTDPGSFTGTALDDGARYLPAGGWSLMELPGSELSSSKRFAPVAWYGSGKMWIWSGFTGSGGKGGSAVTGGASYDPTLAKWNAMSSASEPTARGRSAVVWTGREAVIFGGASSPNEFGGTYNADTFIYRP